MATFNYRLELPLRLARVRLTESRREFALVLAEISRLEEELTGIESMMLENRRQILRRSRQGITGGELADLTHERERAAARIPSIKQRLTEAVAREQEVQDLLKAASSEVKVLEKQRREKKVLFLREEARRQQAGVDDVVLTRKAREMAHAGREK